MKKVPTLKLQLPENVPSREDRFGGKLEISFKVPIIDIGDVRGNDGRRGYVGFLRRSSE